VPCSFKRLNELRLAVEVDRHGRLLDAQRHGCGLERLVRGALLVVVLHVVHAGELALGHDGVALGPRVRLGHAGAEIQDVRLAVLSQTSVW